MSELTLQEKYDKISAMFNEMNNKQAVLEEELLFYKDRFFPKFKYGDRLFVVDITNKGIRELKIDEIVINKFGVAYREFLSETEWMQFPEQYCFESKADAESFLGTIQ